MQQIEDKLKEIRQFLKSKGNTEKSIKTYECVLRKVFLAIGIKFNQKQLEDFFTSRNLSPRSYNNHRAICNFYTKKYLGYEITFTKSKVGIKLATILTEREFFRMIKTTKNFRHKILMSIMYRSGLRVSEVCRVREQDIDLKKYKLFVRQGKGKKDRITVIPKSLAYYLSIYLNKIEDYLFHTRRGYLSIRSAENILKKAVRKAGIKKRIVCHDLRKNFAINLEQKGVKVTRIQKMLGHVKLETTQGYLNCIEDDLTDIAMKT